MKYFTHQSLIPNYHIKIRFSPIMQISKMTSKRVFFMGIILVHIQIVTKQSVKSILG